MNPACSLALTGPPERAFQVMQFNAPTLVNLGLFRPVFCAPEPRIQGRQALHPQPQLACEVVVSEPCWDDRRGPKTHSRRTGRKLGQVRYARQELVRVPESNTKYGGQRGITGVNAAPVIDASISESSGIPKPKKFFEAVKIEQHPLFTGEVFFRAINRSWDCTLETHVSLRRVRTSHAGAAMVAGPK